MTQPVPAPSAAAAGPPGPAAPVAASERGWGRLFFALLAFLFIPTIPQIKAVLPIDDTMLLFVPALATCALVGWWAGGRMFLAAAWVAIAVVMTLEVGTAVTPFYNLVRGWSLLLSGAFGIVCLFSLTRPLFSRALLALTIAMGMAFVMSLMGPVTLSQASTTVSQEFARRNAETMSSMNQVIQMHQAQWTDMTKKVPRLADAVSETPKELSLLSDWGLAVFPALLALESLAALALAWATYHRLGRVRLGAPLRPLREFRFNDQLVWGLIVGLTILLLPTLASLRGTGKNLLVFFAALYAVRGFGVLTWFMAPGSLGITLTVGFIMLCLPLLNVFAALAFIMAAIASLALGLGDTWADWRSRARPTS